MMRLVRFFPALLLLAPAAAWAHAGHPHPEPPGWSFEPWAIVPLFLALVAYLIGLVRLWNRAGSSRPVVRRNATLFLLGWFMLAGAIASPLHEAGGRSFTMHMIEHELIMMVAAPLLALSRPLGVMIWALPLRARVAAGGLGRVRAIVPLWRWMIAPVPATVLQGIVIWAWHAPPLFNAALRHEGWHIVQHLCFLISALLFWWAMAFGRGGARGIGLSALCLFVTSFIGGALGALMTFSASPWYADYAAMGMTPYGLSPEQDQQLAGLIMWIPGGMIHAGVALMMLMRWFAGGAGTRSDAWPVQ